MPTPSADSDRLSCRPRPPATNATSSTRRPSRSSCRRCTRATKLGKRARVHAANWCPSCWSARGCRPWTANRLTVDAESRPQGLEDRSGDRRGARRPVAGRLARFWSGAAGLPEARTLRHRLAGRTPHKVGQRWCVRLVKGAYWDTGGQTRARAATPAIRCTRASPTPTCPTSPARSACSTTARCSHPAFATHNAHTIAAIHRMARGGRSSSSACTAWAPTCHAEVIGEKNPPCHAASTRRWARTRTFAAYLVRCLLENGEHQLRLSTASSTRTWPVKDLVADPVEKPCATSPARPHPRIPQPVRPVRRTTEELHGRQPGNDNELKTLADAIATSPANLGGHAPGAGATPGGTPQNVTDPADRRRVVGTWRAADAATVERAWPTPSPRSQVGSPAGRLARKILGNTADLMEASRGELIALCVREAGKTIPDAIAEVREAVDLPLLRGEARQMMGIPPARPHRRIQPAVPARPRRVRGDQPVELPAGDLHGPGGGRPGDRQRRDR